MRKILENIQKTKPVVQCITNFVTVNDCANIVLACGGSPTMASDFREAEDIAEKADALVLNMGTVSDTDAMIIAGRKSNQLGHPGILDPVGAGGSRFRVDTFRRLSESMQFSVIRGNISEIKAIAFGESDIRGVDAAAADQISEKNSDEIVAMAKKLSAKMKSVIVISGPMDVVASEKTAYLVRNGHPIMAKVTGSGCMSTAMLGAFCGGNPQHILEAALASTVTMGVWGELAYQKTLAQDGGTMTFRMNLIDQVSMINSDVLREMMKVEKI